MTSLVWTNQTMCTVWTRTFLPEFTSDQSDEASEKKNCLKKAQSSLSKGKSRVQVPSQSVAQANQLTQEVIEVTKVTGPGGEAVTPLTLRFNRT